MSKPGYIKEKKARAFLGRKTWVEHVSEYQQSGLTQPEYAKRHNLNTATFRNWITKLKREERATSLQATAFVPVKVNPTTSKDYSGYLMGDGYPGYQLLFKSGVIKHVACNVHARRKFV